MRNALMALTLIAALMTAPLSTKAASADLLVTVQAADVLSDLITYTAKRADTRIEAMHKFLAKIGKEEAFKQASPAAPAGQMLPFTAVVRGAIDFVKNGGSKYADPSLATLTDVELSSQLTELQVYNIQQFMHINEQHKVGQQIKAYLTSAGEWENYLKWAKENSIPTTPAPTTPEGIAAAMNEQINTAQQLAWAKAEARGMTRAEFDQRWAEHIKKYKATVAEEVNGVKALAKSLSAPPPPLPVAPPIANPPPVYIDRPAAPPPLPAPVQSQYTAGRYQQQNNELWNRYDDNNNW